MFARRWSQFVDCVKRYTDRCFTEARRQEFNKAVESPVDSVHQMCTVTTYQTGENSKLNYSFCWNIMDPEFGGKTLETIYQSTWYHISEGLDLHQLPQVHSAL